MIFGLLMPLIGGTAVLAIALAVVERHIGVVSVTDTQVLRAERFLRASFNRLTLAREGQKPIYIKVLL